MKCIVAYSAHIIVVNDRVEICALPGYHTRRRVVIVYRRFGTRIGSIFKGQESEEKRNPAP